MMSRGVAGRRKTSTSPRSKTDAGPDLHIAMPSMGSPADEVVPAGDSSRESIAEPGSIPPRSGHGGAPRGSDKSPKWPRKASDWTINRLSDTPKWRWIVAVITPIVLSFFVALLVGLLLNEKYTTSTSGSARTEDATQWVPSELNAVRITCSSAAVGVVLSLVRFSVKNFIHPRVSGCYTFGDTCPLVCLVVRLPLVCLVLRLPLVLLVVRLPLV